LTTAYRETVMAVPHYDEEYGDSLAESLSVEFGSTIAYQLTNGKALTGATRTAILDAARECRDRRQRLLQVVDAEQESLEDASERLTAIEREYLDVKDQINEETRSSILSDLDDQLETLEQRCLDLVEHRQERIREESIAFRHGADMTILGFLYEETGAGPPVVRTAGNILSRVRETRERCLR
jgi:Rad3-related DNA helicase